MLLRRTLALAMSVTAGSIGTTACGAESHGAAAAHVEPPFEILSREILGARERCVLLQPRAVADARRGALMSVADGDASVWFGLSQIELVALLGPESAERRIVVLRDANQAAVQELRRGGFNERSRRGVYERTPSDVQEPTEVGRACLERARAAPSAVEISVRTAAPIHDERVDAITPRLFERSVFASARGVRIEIADVMRDAVAAQQRLSARNGVSDFTSVLGAAFVDRDGAVVRDDEVDATLRTSWEDLELTRQDDERLRTAMLHDETLQAASGVDVHNVGAVLAEADGRLARLGVLPAGEPRRSAALGLREILARAVTAHPQEDRLYRRLFTLSIRELGDFGAALVVAERALAARVGDDLAWRLNRRTALASMPDADRLARALIADSIVEQSDGARAAQDLVRAVAAGTSYDAAEGLWIAGVRLVSITAETRELNRPTAFPAGTGIAALGILLALGETRPSGIYVIVRGATAARPLTSSGASMTLSIGDDAVRVTAFTVSGLLGGGDLDSATHVLDGVEEGAAVDVLVALVPFGAADGRPSRILRVVGRLQTDRLVVRRATTGVNLELDAQVLALPLAALVPTRTFPPPVWEIHAPDDPSARALLSAAGAERAAQCGRDGLVVRCEGSIADPASARRALMRAATAALIR